LVQGDNTLVAGQMQLDDLGDPVLDINGRPILITSKTFHFFLDDIPPHIIVNSVVPSVANIDGSPQAGSTITVEGDIVDVSLIDSFKFTYPNGSQILTETTNDPVGINEFNNTTKTFSVNLPGYPDVTVPTSSAHFSYTIKDAFEHTTTERFMASGTAISRQKALQINDSLTWNIAPIGNALVNNALVLANGVNILGLGAPRRLGTLSSPAPGDLMEDPLTNCTVSADFPPVIQCIPTAYGSSTRVFIYPSNSNQCSGLLFQPSAGVTHCVAFIKDVRLVSPNVDINFSDNTADQLLATLELWVAEAALDIEVAGIRVVGPDTYYLGGLNGTVSLSRFTVESDIRLTPQSGSLIKATRITPFHLELTDLLKVPTVTGTCNICSPLISPFAMVALALGTDLNSNGKIDKKELITMMGEFIEDKIGAAVDATITGFLPPAVTYTEDVAGPHPNILATKQIIKNMRASNAYKVYGNNAHFVFTGSDSVDPAFYSPTYTVKNGGLGSLFATQGAYYTNLNPTVKGWGITAKGQKIIDLSMAISANSINQWLLANHQTAFFDDFELLMTGADIATADITVDPTDQLRLTFNTNDAPFVQFTSVDTTSASFCNGATLCLNGNKASPGSIKLTVRDLDLLLENVTDTQVLVDVNMDITLAVDISLIGGLPSIKLQDDSLAVTVNSVTEPSSLLVTNATVATMVADAIESYMTSASYQALIGQRVIPLSLATLPGYGGSGVGCAGPSIDGQFCAAGTSVSYSSLLTGAIPRDFAVLFRWLTIEKGGSYLTMGLDVRNKPPTSWTAQELSDNFITIQVTN
jgi:hypothetical protein